MRGIMNFMRSHNGFDMLPKLLEDTLLLVFDIDHDMQLIKDVFDFSEKLALGIDVEERFRLVFGKVRDRIL